MQISDPDKREYYELEAVNNAWTGRELKRQIDSVLYERLLMSNDKETVLSVARKERIPESPTEIVKDPMVLEFLGLKPQASYYERDLEQAIISHIAEFMLEMKACDSPRCPTKTKTGWRTCRSIMLKS